MKNKLASMLLITAGVVAQQPVAPTPETVGRSRGEDVGGYNYTNQFETGYRFRSIGGNFDRYRSDVNYGNGIRLLGSNLTVHSKEGHGKLFDELVLTTLGLGNDPYQHASLRLQHNKFYRYDLTWRLNEYLNPGLTSGGHWLNTRRHLQDHDVTLLPQSSFKFFAGYSRNSQDGPALSTIQIFDSRGDEFPFFSNIDRTQTEYRVGGEASARGFKLIVLRGWQRYEEATSYNRDQVHPGANLTDNTTLTSLRRTEPYDGNTPFWRANLLSEKKTWFAANARMSYAGGRRGYAFDEAVAGTDRFGSARSRQILVSGAGSRPVTSAGFTFSLTPSIRFTLTNHTAFHQVAMNGNGSYQELINSAASFSAFRFQHLGIRSIVNATDASWRASRWIGFYGGYHYSNRRVRSREGESGIGFSDVVTAEQTNRLHAGLGGVRLQPARPVSINLDVEVGRASRPFFPLSERRYHSLGGRIQYKTRTLLLAAATRANYNTNSVSLFTHSARSRNYSFDASWTGKGWLSVDAGYSKLHLDTLTGIAYFASTRLVEGDESIYLSNLHHGHLGVRMNIQKRADFYAGYSRIKDTGDGRSVAAQVGERTGSALVAFRVVQTFPLSYDSPQARLSIRLYDKIRWNLGYQYYRYKEEFLASQFYRAHTGYTSVLWSF